MEKIKLYTLIVLAACVMAVSACGSQKSAASSYEHVSKSDGYMDSETASIDRIEISDTDKVSYRSVEDYLQTKVAGIEISPSGGIVIRGMGTINGTSQPLILYDGSEVIDTSTINPSDIHSVDVIKDGSTAAYGMRGANGVILITSKAAYEVKQAEKEARRREKEARKAARRK